MSRRTTEITRSIRELTIEHVTAIDGKKYPAMMITLRRLEDLVAADNTATVTIDGYPTKSSLAGPPTARGVRIDPETGDVIAPDPELAGGSNDPAGRAAIARIDNPNPADALHRIRVSAERSAEIVARELTILATTLDRADNLRSTVPTTIEYCYVARLHGLPHDIIWEPHCKTTFRSVLKPAWPEERPVSRWVYDFTRDHKRLPTEAEMRSRLEREGVLIRAAS